MAASLHALDPDKRISQYMHTSWRMQDGSAPAGVSSLTQSSDGFVWLTSLSGDAYRFDGVQFVPWRFSNDGTVRNFRIFGDHGGGVWAFDSTGGVYQSTACPTPASNWRDCGSCKR